MARESIRKPIASVTLTEPLDHWTDDCSYRHKNLIDLDLSEFRSDQKDYNIPLMVMAQPALDASGCLEEGFLQPSPCQIIDFPQRLAQDMTRLALKSSLPFEMSLSNSGPCLCALAPCGS